MKLKKKNQNFWRFSGNEKKYISSLLKKGFKPKDIPFSEKLENKWSKIHNIKYSICVNSCTSALHVAFMSIGINKGDEVLVPALTPIMCGTSIHLAGGVPIYVDVDPETFLLDDEDLKKKITKKTKAILAVHMYSGICNLNKLKNICKKKKLYLIEDCAEAVGAKDENRNLTGTVGDISCWSFQAAKQLTSGDGGILSTNNRTLAKKIRKFSNLGFRTLEADNSKILISKNERQNPSYKRFDEVGFNYRMNEFTASIVLAQAEQIKKFIKLRRNSAKEFEKVLSINNNFKIQKISQKSYSTYYTFAALFNPKKSIKVSWHEFRKKFMQFGGDGIYAASRLIQQEPAVKKYKIGRCFKNCSKNCINNCTGTPNAKKIQKNLLLFTTNQANNIEIKKQIIALKKTINFFKLN